MTKKLAIAVVAVTALFLSTFTAVSTTQTVEAQSATWDVNAYGPQPSSDNAILYWNEWLLQIIRKHPPQTGPTVVARALGVLHTATYDAWAAYDPVAKGTRLGSQLRRPPEEHTLPNKEKAISYAAYRVLTDLFPVGADYPKMGEGDGKVDLRKAMTDRTYDPDDMSTDTTTPQGIGNKVAAALMEGPTGRHRDGSNQLGDEPGGTPGKRYSDYTGYTPKNQWNTVPKVFNWQPLCVPTPPAGATTCSGNVQNAATPQWQRVKPFALMSPFQYTVLGPPKIPGTNNYSTAEIQTAVNDAAGLEFDYTKKVKAEYWADGPGSVFPPGHDFIFAQALSRKRLHSLDTDVKFFFVLGNAMMDASIASWAQKYKYDYVRPITAIRHNPSFKTKKVRSWLGPNNGFGTVDGSQWIPYQALHVVTPPFPEYVSGHSTFSGAGATVLAAFIGSDTFNAHVDIPQGWSTFETNVPPQPVRLSWATFSHAADEAGWSRRWGGIHFQSGDYHGRGLGRQVAQHVWGLAQAYIKGRTSG